jgi:hypothetical protein
MPGIQSGDKVGLIPATEARTSWSPRHDRLDLHPCINLDTDWCFVDSLRVRPAWGDRCLFRDGGALGRAAPFSQGPSGSPRSDLPLRRPGGRAPIVARRRFTPWLKGRSETGGVGSEVLPVGTRATAQADFVQGLGVVILNGVRWNAESQDAIRAGDPVWLTGRQGLILRVSATPPQAALMPPSNER